MKVILTEDVKNLGRKGALCDVSDGYARNFLIPKKLAVRATEGNQQDLEHKKKKEEERRRKEKEEAVLLCGQIEALELEMQVKTGEKGRLFGSVTNKEIAETMLEKHGVQIDRRKIELKGAIKAVGDYEAVVKLYPEISARLKIKITAQ